jgi:hypothetical protein
MLAQPRCMFAFTVPMGGKSLLQELVSQDTCLSKAPDLFAHFEVNVFVVHFVVEVVLLNDPWGEQSNWDVHVFVSVKWR